MEACPQTSEHSQAQGPQSGETTHLQGSEPLSAARTLLVGLPLWPSALTAGVGLLRCHRGRVAPKPAAQGARSSLGTLQHVLGGLRP